MLELPHCECASAYQRNQSKSSRTTSQAGLNSTKRLTDYNAKTKASWWQGLRIAGQRETVANNNPGNINDGRGTRRQRISSLTHANVAYASWGR